MMMIHEAIIPFFFIVIFFILVTVKRLPTFTPNDSNNDQIINNNNRVLDQDNSQSVQHVRLPHASNVASSDNYNTKEYNSDDTNNDLLRCHLRGLYDSITNQCKCFQCQSGSTCLSPSPNCIFDATSANPVMYELFWSSLPTTSTSSKVNNIDNSKLTLSHDWRIGHYSFEDGSANSVIVKDDKHYASLELEKSLRALHSHVGNADIDQHELVIGVGSTQLMHAALYAYEKKLKRTRYTEIMNVTARYPYYDEHKLSADFLPGVQWIKYPILDKRQNFDKGSLSFMECDVEIITMPGNPDATMMDHSDSPCLHQIYDHAYYWPQYTPILKKVKSDIMLFTLTKLTGHAGTRIGWAWVKDPEIAQYMRYFINLISHGVPHESQIRASFLLKHVVKKTQGLLEWGLDEMMDRWDRLENVLKHTNRFVLEKRLGPFYDLFHTSERFATPAYLWMKCGWEQDLKKGGGSCQKFLLDAINVIGRDGEMYGANNEHVRLSLLSRASEFDILLERLTELVPLEWSFPVTLYDVDGLEKAHHSTNENLAAILQHSSYSYVRKRPRNPPRYVVGVLQFPSTSQPHWNSRSSDTGTSSTFQATAQHMATFDLGNSKETLLTVQDCLGCRSNIETHSGCPSKVPLCQSNHTDNNFCWSTHPNQYVPDIAFEYTNKNCSDDGKYAGQLMNESVCMQCFDDADHSRYTISAMAYEMFLSRASVKSIDEVIAPTPPIMNFEFGALVRTVPHRNRIWSNVGIGARSSFLKQLEVNSLLLDFDYYGRKRHFNQKTDRIVFNPSLTLYKDWESSTYIVKHDKRLHPVNGFYFGDEANQNENSTDINILFHIDTGNNGISIHDKDLLTDLAIGCNGEWVSYSDNQDSTKILRTSWNQEDGPDLSIVLEGGLKVILPASIWVLNVGNNESDGDAVSSLKVRRSLDDTGLDVNVISEIGLPNTNSTMNPTIFSTYHKNVFGLPFLSAPGYSFIFDDEIKKLFVGAK